VVLPLGPRPHLGILPQPNSVMLVRTVGVAKTFSLVGSSCRFSGAHRTMFRVTSLGQVQTCLYVRRDLRIEVFSHEQFPARLLPDASKYDQRFPFAAVLPPTIGQ